MTISKVFFHKKLKQLDGMGYKGDFELQIIGTQKMHKYLKEMKNKYIHKRGHGQTKPKERERAIECSRYIDFSCISIFFILPL